MKKILFLMKFASSIIACSYLVSCVAHSPPHVDAAKHYNSRKAHTLALMSDVAYEERKSEIMAAAKKKLPDYTLLGNIDNGGSKYDSQLAVFYNDVEIVVAVRGSESRNDWFNNFKVWSYVNPNLSTVDSGIGVHGGFLGNASSLISNDGGIYDDIVKLQKKGNRKLYFTGHSLGGSIASILAFQAVHDGRVKVHGIYTYGQAKEGNSIYQKRFNEVLGDRKFFFVNNRDIVARVKTRSMLHTGNLVYIDRKAELNKFSDPMGINHVLENLALRFVFDHRMKNYESATKKNMGFSPFE